MNKLCLATLALCLVAANAAGSNPITPTGPALIAQVCKRKTMPSKDLCSSSLTADPGSKNADLTKLTLISIRIASLMALDNWGYAFPKQQGITGGYVTCTSNYALAVETCDDALAALVAQKYDYVKTMMGTAMLMEDTCFLSWKGSKEKEMFDRNMNFRNQCMVINDLVDALKGL